MGEGREESAEEVKKLEELEPAVGGQEPQIVSDISITPPALDITSVVTAQGESVFEKESAESGYVVVA